MNLTAFNFISIVMTFFKNNAIIFILLTVTLATEMGTDIFVPSLPQMLDYFATDKATISFAVGIGFVGMLLGGFFFGPLSDRFGRKVMMLLGIGFFTIGSLICAVSPNPSMLIAARLIQGIGIIVGYVLGITILKDLYHGKEFAKRMSTFHLLIGITPAIAPMLGGYLAEHFDWRASFICLVFLGILAAFVFSTIPETLSKDKHRSVNLTSIFKNMVTLFNNTLYTSYVLISGIIYSGFWVYLSESPYVFHNMGFDQQQFGYFQTILVIYYMLGSFINERLVGKIPVFTLLGIGLLVCLLGTTLLILAASHPSALFISFAAGLYCCGSGAVYTNAATLALEIFPRLSGAASSTLTFVGCSLPAIVIASMNLFRDSTVLPIALTMAILVFSSLAIFAVVKRNKIQHTP